MQGFRSAVRPIVIGAALLTVCASFSASAQVPESLHGDFAGVLGPLSLKLHIEPGPDGKPTCTLDSPNQGAIGIPCSDLAVEGSALSFKVPAVNGTWRGTIENGGTSLAGTWSQGTPMPLTFARDTFVPAEKPSPVDGIWLGTSEFQGRTVRTQLIVESDIKGQRRCTVDSPDLNVFGLACANITYSKADFAFDVPSVQGQWRGRLSADGASLHGTWTVGGNDSPPPSKLDFEKQAQRINAGSPARPPVYLPAAAPASAAEMQDVLRRDLAKTRATGLLAKGKPTAVSIGVLRDGKDNVFTLGTAQQDSVFEIGSITKTFTGLAMAQMIEQGKVKPETPVRELLPAGTVGKPAGAEITLLDLVTHRSGLPRMPDNFAPADPANPYVDYGARNLYQFIGKHGVEKPRDATFLYSNVGVGLLGQALALRAAAAYPDFIRKTVLEPLGMTDTAIALSPAQRGRFATPLTADLRPASAWDLDALAGAGAIRSTAADMLRYLEAHLDPAAHPSLTSALKRSHELQADNGDGSRIGYAWIYDSRSGTYWHNGGTGGFTSFAFFNPEGNYAGVVLANVAIGPRGSFADQLGHHVRQRLAGERAISLDDW
jgi:D-alanyl-D-alanine-carboxypeptidase/D-alanyl-D-alanine-endopeptidase